jgi:hypothetical protein
VARPYICRLIILMRLTLPSNAPELWGRVMPAVTAARSRRRVRANAASAGRVSAGFHRGDPGRETVAVELDQEAGEVADVGGQSVRSGLRGQDAFQRGVVVGVEPVGPGHDPPAGLADGRRNWLESGAGRPSRKRCR